MSDNFPCQDIFEHDVRTVYLLYPPGLVRIGQVEAGQSFEQWLKDLGDERAEGCLVYFDLFLGIEDAIIIAPSTTAGQINRNTCFKQESDDELIYVESCNPNHIVDLPNGIQWSIEHAIQGAPT